ncbi:transcriptional repressor NF-X1-like [Tubulanus polymorphus]|uniref:transcriptional repressor NF-X1-like n=1 Tax=Tubulanus polymorphus TaxID=672921 RepID=UPI003DA5EDA6
MEQQFPNYDEYGYNYDEYGYCYDYNYGYDYDYSGYWDGHFDYSNGFYEFQETPAAPGNNADSVESRPDSTQRGVVAEAGGGARPKSRGRNRGGVPMNRGATERSKTSRGRWKNYDRRAENRDNRNEDRADKSSRGVQRRGSRGGRAGRGRGGAATRGVGDTNSDFDRESERYRDEKSDRSNGCGNDVFKYRDVRIAEEEDRKTRVKPPSRSKRDTRAEDFDENNERSNGVGNCSFKSRYGDVRVVGNEDRKTLRSERDVHDRYTAPARDNYRYRPPDRRGHQAGNDYRVDDENFDGDCGYGPDNKGPESGRERKGTHKKGTNGDRVPRNKDTKQIDRGSYEQTSNGDRVPRNKDTRGIDRGSYEQTSNGDRVPRNNNTRGIDRGSYEQTSNGDRVPRNKDTRGIDRGSYEQTSNGDRVPRNKDTRGIDRGSYEQTSNGDRVPRNNNTRGIDQGSYEQTSNGDRVPRNNNTRGIDRGSYEQTSNGDRVPRNKDTKQIDRGSYEQTSNGDRVPRNKDTTGIDQGSYEQASNGDRVPRNKNTRWKDQGSYKKPSGKDKMAKYGKNKGSYDNGCNKDGDFYNKSYGRGRGTYDRGFSARDFNGKVKDSYEKGFGEDKGSSGHNRGSRDRGSYDGAKDSTGFAVRTGDKIVYNRRELKKMTNEELETQRGSLIDQLIQNTYECMICYDVVKHEAAVWNCRSCYHIFHLRCIKTWSRSPVAMVDGEDSGWRCPACQNINDRLPHHYYCFCGKAQDPVYSRYETPHGCGEVCKRSRDCPHKCNILCHPGPCPPCNATTTKNCDCGKISKTVKCGLSVNVKCENQCEKQLNCGLHDCANLCHSGPCDPCSQEIKQVCFCGQEECTVLCGTEESLLTSFSCQKVCQKLLKCGEHRCELECHEGDCLQCSLAPDILSHCPCGKTELTSIANASRRSSCIDVVPTCSEICDKQLDCGPEAKRHRCKMPCHTGPCAQCDLETPVQCRCHYVTKDFPCEEAVKFTVDEPFTCEKRCNKKKSCGRHKCPRLCCVDTEHPCNAICSRKLTCGLHKCEDVCHRTNCHSCWHVSFDELTCYCGHEIQYPPIPCGAKPPECHQLCTRKHSCDHPVRHNCHSDATCPPCTELTEKMCMGGHELRKFIPCYRVDISCGLPCNKLLSCSNHKCQKTCHKGVCLEEGEVCKQLCVLARELCGHACAAPCHGNWPCPQTACKAEMKITCACGHRSENVICNLGGKQEDTALVMEYKKITTSSLTNRIIDIQSGNNIDLKSLINKSTAAKIHRIDCNEECGRIERNRRIALALEITNPNLESKLGNPSYSTFLKDFARLNSAFVANVEKSFCALVQNAKQSKHPNRSHSFAPMNREQRRLLHELAEWYGCKTQSYDQEPKKNVVATAYKDKCWLPNVTLTTCVQREIHGKRPVPIPHNKSEKEIATAAQASKQSTNISGLTPFDSNHDLMKTKRVEKKVDYFDYFEMTD